MYTATQKDLVVMAVYSIVQNTFRNMFKFRNMFLRNMFRNMFRNWLVRNEMFQDFMGTDLLIGAPYFEYWNLV